jgi:hypothetical protein
MEGNKMKRLLITIIGCLFLPIWAFASDGKLAKSEPLFNPGYLGKKQAISVYAVTNFSGLWSETPKYQTNYAFAYEVARKSTLSYQFGYKSFNRSMRFGDVESYRMSVVVPGGGWSGDQNYRPYGSMGIHYREFTVGVKNYLSTAGSTAPFGGYLVANLHFGSAKSTANDLRWLNYYSSSMLDTITPVGSEGISSKMTSISYGFGTRNMITEHVGFSFEMTSGLTLKNAAGVKLYNVDNYSSDYNCSTQQEVMTSIMLREIHRSQWVQLKFGLSYLF